MKNKRAQNKFALILASLIILLSGSIKVFAEDYMIIMLTTFEAKSKTVLVGEKKVPMLAFMTSAVQKEQKLHKFTIEFYADSDTNFDNTTGNLKASHFIQSASLYDKQGNVISGPTALIDYNNYQRAIFDNLNITLSPNEQKEFMVKVDMLSAIGKSKAYLAAGLKTADIIAEETESMNASPVKGGHVDPDLNIKAQKDPIITIIEKGELTATTDADNIGDLLPNQNTGWLAIYIFNAINENFNIERLTVMNDLEGEIDQPEDNCLLKSAEIEYGSNSAGFKKETINFSGGKATFENLNALVKTDDPLSISLSANLEDPANCSPEKMKDYIRLGIQTKNSDASTFYATGEKSSAQIIEPGVVIKEELKKDKIIIPLQAADELIVSSSNTVKGGEYKTDAQEVGFLSLHLEGGKQKHKLLKLKVKFYGDDDGSFDNGIGDHPANRNIVSASLYDGQNRLSGPKSLEKKGDYYQVEFNSLSLEVPKGSKKELIVKINLNKAETEKIYLMGALKINDDYLSAEDENQNQSVIKGATSEIKGSKIIVLATKKEVDEKTEEDKNEDEEKKSEEEMEEKETKEGEDKEVEKENKEEDEEDSRLKIKSLEEQLKKLEKEKAELINHLKKVQTLIEKVKKYKFTKATENEFKESIDRLENNLKKEGLKERDIDRQKAIFEKRYAVIKDKSRQEKFDKGVIPFKDTDDDNWFFTFVEFAKNKKIINGYKDKSGKLTGEFKPSRDVTRAEILKMALETSGHGQAQVSNLTFDKWSRLYVQKAKDLNIDFYKKVIANHRQPATRGEVIRLIFDVFGITAPEKITFSLSDLKGEDGKWIQHAVNLGIVSGYPDGSFKQDDPINRAEVAKILKNAFEKLK